MLRLQTPLDERYTSAPQSELSARIEAAKQALGSGDVKNAYLKNGATPLWMNVADTVAYRRAEEIRFGPIVKAAGAKVD